MPRLHQVPLAEATPEVAQMYERLFPGRDPVESPGTATGTPGNWWTVFAGAPDIFNHAQAAFGMFSSKRRKLAPYHRELGLTRTGFAAGSQFVFSQHCKAARAAGISVEKVAAIPSWSSSPVFSDEDRVILGYTDDLVLGDGRVQQATMDSLKALMSDEAILELTYAVCTYKLHATMCRALRLEYDDVDERVVEIAAPGQANADVMAQISR